MLSNRNVKRIRTVLTAALLVLLPMTAGICSAERLAVSVPKANVRSGPGTGHDVLWEVEQYHPLMIISKQGDWYQFRDFEGDRAWIHSTLVKEIPAVITARENCNVRSNPDTKSKILFTAEKGIPFKVLKRKDKWLFVQHADGDEGWIHSSLTW